MKLLEKLSPGEYICPKCGGQGEINRPEEILIRREFIIVTSKTISTAGGTCSMCLGCGKLTWTEYARGISSRTQPLEGWGRTQTTFYIGFEWTSFFMTPLIKSIYAREQRQRYKE